MVPELGGVFGEADDAWFFGVGFGAAAAFLEDGGEVEEVLVDEEAGFFAADEEGYDGDLGRAEGC